MCSPSAQGTAARIVGRVLLGNAEPSAAGLRTVHERIRGAQALAAALRLADCEAELEWIGNHLWDARDTCRIDDWTPKEIKAAVARLIERIE